MKVAWLYAIPESDAKHSSSDDINSLAQRLDYGHEECLASDEYFSGCEEFGAARCGRPLWRK